MTGLVAAGLLFAAQANARDGQALVQSVSGKATMLVDGNKWLPLQTGQLLKTGAVVKTGAKSEFLFGRNEGGGQRFHRWLDALLASDDAGLWQLFAKGIE